MKNSVSYLQGGPRKVNHNQLRIIIVLNTASEARFFINFEHKISTRIL